MWKSIKENPPKPFITVLTQHEDDLHPVTAFYMHGGNVGGWLRESEGAEDVANDIRHTALFRAPTHWQELPESPLVQKERLNLK